MAEVRGPDRPRSHHIGGYFPKILAETINKFSTTSRHPRHGSPVGTCMVPTSMHDPSAPFHHWTRPWDASGAREAAIPTRSTRTHIIKHAASRASTAKTCKMSTQARAQRGTEMPGEPGITARAQGSTEREPSSDGHMQRASRALPKPWQNELRTRRNATRQVRHVRDALGMRRGSRGCVALHHRVRIGTRCSPPECSSSEPPCLHTDESTHAQGAR